MDFLSSGVRLRVKYDTETGLYYLQSRYYNPEWGRFINADGIVGANQDILSNNLWTYCSNNPVRYADYSGENTADVLNWGWTTGGIISQLDSPLPGPGDAIGLGVGIGETAVAGIMIIPWDRVGKGISDGWAWISKQARTVSNKVADSFARSVPRTYRSPREEHHLVAQAGPNAQPAREILEDVGIGVNSSANLVTIKTSLHRRLHTNSYYGYVNSMIISAYNRGRTASGRRNNVYAALSKLRAYVKTLDATTPW